MPHGDDYWIVTYSGKKFWPLSPHAEDVDIEDIAHSLSNLCRFNGHCTSFYSVAQHSVIISEHCDPENAMWGLLHDAAEAYLGDLSRPLKKHPGFALEFRIAERHLMNVICMKFGLPFEEPPQVKEFDNRLLMTEKQQVVRLNDHVWTEVQGHGVPMPIEIKPWEPKVARCYFMMRYELLCNKMKSKSATS